MNNIMELADNSCTSCSLCAAICPVNAITIELSEEGFWRPIINDECIHCGKCKNVCYKGDTQVVMSNVATRIIAAKNTDKNILRQSSSGGVSDGLARSFLKRGYRVVGTAYDYGHSIAKAVIIDNEEDLYKIRGSKYFQSYTVDAFRIALEDKKSNYVVFGTPCQIYAFSRYLEKPDDRERFILVDIFCHGTPSLKVWLKYDSMVKKKMGVSKFDNIEFRSKYKGWHRFCTRFFSGQNSWVSPLAGDRFYTLFFSKDLFNEACYDCKMRSTLGYTDIRMGDFWGFRYDKDKHGTSIVVAASERGKMALQEALSQNNFLIELDEILFAEAVKAQSYGEIHKKNENRRTALLEALKTNMSVDEVYKLYLSKLTGKEHIRRIYKNIIKVLPLSFTGRIKSIFHRL